MPIIESSSEDGRTAAPAGAIAATVRTFSQNGLGFLTPFVALVFVIAAPFILLNWCFSWIAGRRQAVAKTSRDTEEMASFVYPLF